MLAHAVYFTLNDPTPAAVRALVAACREHLAGHQGTQHFSVGPRDAELCRPVNDVGFDVALMMIFDDRAAHDRYQVHPRHQAFIAENKAHWKNVRVFDAETAPA